MLHLKRRLLFYHRKIVFFCSMGHIHIHVHAENECRALINTCRVATDSATSVLSDLLAYQQTHTDTFVVKISLIILNGAEKSEQLLDAFRMDTTTLINYMHAKLLLLLIIAGFYLNGHTRAVLEGILCQVDKHLFEANLVTHQLFW